MKTKITLAMVMFIGFVLCSTVVAYMPTLIIRECPHCKAHVVQEETVSGNTIGATYWTDGKREAKMLPDHPWLAKCPVCSGLFWVDEAVEVDTGFDAAKGKQQVLAPSEKELLGFLSGPALPRDKELYVRVCGMAKRERCLALESECDAGIFQRPGAEPQGLVRDAG